jgi:hypothetical protein
MFPDVVPVTNPVIGRIRDANQDLGEKDISIIFPSENWDKMVRKCFL